MRVNIVYDNQGNILAATVAGDGADQFILQEGEQEGEFDERASEDAKRVHRAAIVLPMRCRVCIAGVRRRLVWEYVKELGIGFPHAPCNHIAGPLPTAIRHRGMRLTRHSPCDVLVRTTLATNKARDPMLATKVQAAVDRRIDASEL